MAITLTTTSQMIFSSKTKPASFSVHSLISNSVNVQLSQEDPSAATDYEELQPGQSAFFENFVGTLYGVSASSTAVVTVPFIQYNTIATVNSKT